MGSSTPLFYNSYIALESLEGWFLSVDPHTGAMGLLEPDPGWYESGSLPFEAKAGAGPSSRLFASSSRPVSGRGMLRPSWARGVSAVPSPPTGRIRSDTTPVTTPPLWVFKLMDLRQPLAAGPVRAGDPIWLEIVSPSANAASVQGRAMQAAQQQQAGGYDWRQGSAVVASHVYELAELGSPAVNVEGHPLGWRANAGAARSAREREPDAAADFDVPGTPPNPSRESTRGMGGDGSSQCEIALRVPTTRASQLARVPRVNYVRTGELGKDGSPSQAGRGAPVDEVEVLFARCQDRQSGSGSGASPLLYHLAAAAAAADLAAAAAADGSPAVDEAVVAAAAALWGVPGPVAAFVPQGSDVLHGPPTADNPSGRYGSLDSEYAALYAEVNHRPLVAGKWLLQGARRSEAAARRRRDGPEMPESRVSAPRSDGGGDGHVTQAVQGRGPAQRQCRETAPAPAAALGNFDEVFLQQDLVYVCSRGGPGGGEPSQPPPQQLAVTPQQGLCGPLSPEAAAPVAHRRFTASAAPNRRRPAFLQPMGGEAAEGGGGGGGGFHVGEGGVFRLRLLQVGEGVGGRRGASGETRLGDSVALLASTQLRASEKRRLGVAVAQWPAALRRHGRVAAADQAPLPGDATAAANIAVLARARREESVRRCARIYTEHERGRRPRERSQRLLRAAGGRGETRPQAGSPPASPLQQPRPASRSPAGSDTREGGVRGRRRPRSAQTAPPQQRGRGGAAAAVCALCGYARGGAIASAGGVDLCAENAAALAQRAGERAPLPSADRGTQGAAAVIWFPDHSEDARAATQQSGWSASFAAEDAMLKAVVAAAAAVAAHLTSPVARGPAPAARELSQRD